MSKRRRRAAWCFGLRYWNGYKRSDGEVPGRASLAQDDEYKNTVIPESRSDIRDLPRAEYAVGAESLKIFVQILFDVLFHRIQMIAEEVVAAFNHIVINGDILLFA